MVEDYGAPLLTIFGDELSVRCWVVGVRLCIYGLMFPPSVFEDRCVDL